MMGGSVMRFRRRGVLALASCLIAMLVLFSPAGPQLLFAAGLERPAVALTAFAELGPVGLTCLSRDAAYEYRPDRQRFHWGLFRELPETALRLHFDDAADARWAGVEEVVVERVSVNIQLPVAPAQARVQLLWTDGRHEQYIVQLYSQGGSAWVSLDTPEVEVMLCSKQFGNWRVSEVVEAG